MIDPAQSQIDDPTTVGTPVPIYRRRALHRGIRDSVGAPVLLLFASYLGFGSLVHSSDLSLFAGLFSTISTFALPGQIVVVELYATGATLTVIAIAVALTNVRLLPMTLSLIPHLGHVAPWKRYGVAHMIAVTGWVQALGIFGRLPVAERLPYYVGFSGMLIVSTLVGTTIGFLLADAVPTAVSLGLVFVNPLYFALVLSRNLTVRTHAWAMALGALLGPGLHLASPNWGLLATGLIAGTAGFLIGQRRRRPGHD